MTGFLNVERRGRIAILTMAKPESMNAIGTHQDCEDIVSALAALNADRGVSAIILTGSGKAFSAGGNLKAMAARTGIGVLDQPDSTRANYRQGVQRVIREVEPHDSIERYTALGVECLTGEARITSPWTVEIRTATGVQTLTTRSIIIAAGALLLVFGRRK